MKDLFIGIDIGGTKCAVVTGDSNGEIYNKSSFPTTGFEETYARIMEETEKKIVPGICAIGISCGSPLDSRRGVILSPPNLPGWNDVRIVEDLEKRFGIPAFLKNDADACAVAEWKWGNGKGKKNVIFMTFGTGMGAGLILGGKPYSGGCDSAGEIGHMRLYEGGHIGYGKEGSFEGYCSGGGIAQYGMGSVKELHEKADKGDAAVRALFEKIGDDLGKGLSILIDLLNPDVIIIGSIYSRCSQYLDNAMYARIRKECLPWAAEHVRILPAALGDKIGDAAALSVAYDGYIRIVGAGQKAAAL